MHLKKIIAIATGLFALNSCITVQAPSSNKTTSIEPAPQAVSNIEYYPGSFEEFIINAKAQNKPLLLEFWASWCGPCIRMDRETYSDQNLGSYINDNFLMYKIDADSFDGLEAAGKYKVDSYPALLILTPSGELLQYVKGFYLPENLKSILTRHI